MQGCWVNGIEHDVGGRKSAHDCSHLGVQVDEGRYAGLQDTSCSVHLLKPPSPLLQVLIQIATCRHSHISTR